MASARDKASVDLRKEQEAYRYRMAAENALKQLDWTIGYLDRIHKKKIATTLARNRSYIVRRLREGDG